MKIPNTNTTNLKNLLNEDNKTRMIGLLTITLILWTVLYLIPEVFASLFNTFLGNFLLILISIVTLLYNKMYGIIISLILIILYRFQKLSSNPNKFKENFTQDSTREFLLIQNSINPDIIFDLNMIQNQASQQELDYFNTHGIWPWSQETKDMYVEALNTNPYIRTYSPNELPYVMKIYNESAIKEILFNQSNEGQALLNGVLVNLTTELLERTVYTGKGGIFGEQTSIVNPVDYNNLESIIPGFNFIDEPCNPCTSAYSCHFQYYKD